MNWGSKRRERRLTSLKARRRELQAMIETILMFMKSTGTCSVWDKEQLIKMKGELERTKVDIEHLAREVDKDIAKEMGVKL